MNAFFSSLMESPEQMMIGIAAGVLLLCALGSFLLGAFRFAFFGLSFIAGVSCALWGHVKVDVLTQIMGWENGLFGVSAIYLIPTLCFLIGFLFFEFIKRLIVKPFFALMPKKDDEKKGLFSYVISFTLTLIPTIVIFAVIVSGVRRVAAEEELAMWLTASYDEPTSSQVKLKRYIDAHIPHPVERVMYGLYDPRRLVLARIVANYDSLFAEKRTEENEEVYPYVLNIYRNKTFHKTLVRVEGEDSIRALIQEQRFSEVLESKAINRALDETDIRKNADELVKLGF